MSTKKYILRIQNLSSGYNGTLVLKDFNLDLEQNEILALIGQNGSGKSTLFKSVFQMANVKTGETFFKGKNITKLKTSDLVKEGISYYMQEGLIFPGLTIKEHLDLASGGKIKDEMLVEILQYFPKLKGSIKRRAGNLSGGQRQGLSLAMLLAQETSLWLLDEPIAGLDPERVEMTIDFLKKMNKEKGISILLTEHNYDAAFMLAHNVCVIKEGKAGEKFGPEIFRQSSFLDDYVYI